MKGFQSCYLCRLDCKLCKRHVPNCVEPQQIEETYNLNGWINSLHLQQCVFVAIGENFFAIFLEKIPRPFDEDQEIKDYFVGICDAESLKKWKLCPVPVELKRPEDCVFEKDLQQSARVHRRLCDLSELTNFASRCNCDALFRGEKLVNVVGFPTCFRSHIENFLCGYNNVCGLNSCKMTMVANRIYAVKCDENCFGHKPFCESPEWKTSKPREISSFWSDWSESECTNVECMSMTSEAKCINKETAMGDVDCLGPGTSCCPKGLDNCRCHVFIEDGMSKLIRMYSVHQIPEYEEVSLEEFIKNLPLTNERTQLQPKLRRKYRLAEADPQSDSRDVCVHEDVSAKARSKFVRIADDDEDEDDDNNDINSIESDEDANGEDDIMIEEDIPTTQKPYDDEDLENKEIAIHEFRAAHVNENIIDVPNRDAHKPKNIGKTTSYDRFFAISYSILLFVAYVTIIDLFY
ncbi:hypothetical protein Trydic_g23702 [Trypoxylus dichotomus]